MVKRRFNKSKTIVDEDGDAFLSVKCKGTFAKSDMREIRKRIDSVLNEWLNPEAEPAAPNS